MTVNRRDFLALMLAAGAAPAIVRAGSLMRVRALGNPFYRDAHRDWLQYVAAENTAARVEAAVSRIVVPVAVDGRVAWSEPWVALPFDQFPQFDQLTVDVPLGVDPRSAIDRAVAEYRKGKR